MTDAPRRGDRSGASLASEQTGTGEGQRQMAQPHTRSAVVGGKPDWGAVSTRNSNASVATDIVPDVSYRRDGGRQ